MGEAMIALSPRDAGQRKRTAYAGRVDGGTITPGLSLLPGEKTWQIHRVGPCKRPK